MRSVLLIIFFSFVITGCKNKDKTPVGVMTQEKMQEILWDMMRADQFLNDFVLNKDTGLDKNAERKKIYGQIFSMHQISKEQFSESFSFYKSHPALFKIIMDSISKPKIEAPTEMVNPPARQDSFSQIQQNLKDSIKSFRKKKRLPMN